MYDENNNQQNNGVGNEATSSTDELNKNANSSASSSNVGNTYSGNSGYKGYDFGQAARGTQSTPTTQGTPVTQGAQPYAGGAYSGQRPVQVPGQNPFGAPGQNPASFAGVRPTPVAGQAPNPMAGTRPAPNPMAGQTPGPMAGQTPSPMAGQRPAPTAQGQSPFAGPGAFTGNSQGIFGGANSFGAPTEDPASYGGYSKSAQGSYGEEKTETTTAFGGFTSEPPKEPKPQQEQTHTYGTYEFTDNAPEKKDEKLPEKKHTPLAFFIAAVLGLTLIVGGIGAAYHFARNNEQPTGQELAQNDGDNTGDDAGNNTGDDQGTQAQTPAPTISQTNTNSPIVATTTSGQSMAVVTDVTEVVKENMPACVIIHNYFTVSSNYFGYTYKDEATASGSGFIVGQNDTELLIATNYHVIEGADKLEVIFNDDTTLEAVVKGTESDMDLAVIAVPLSTIPEETANSIKIATLGDSDQLALGEPCVAIGNALGIGQSVTTGVISALNREVEVEEGVSRTFIQTDAAINHGNSGGALLNLQGEVIGINSAKLGGDTIEGMGYAIPISAAKPIIEKLMNEITRLKVAESERGYLGISSGVSVTSDVQDIYGLPLGVYLAEIVPSGALAQAGVQRGDVIVTLDGEEITSMEDLNNRMQYYAAGTEVEVTVKRAAGADYEEMTFKVTLTDLESLQGTEGDGGDSNGAKGKYNGPQLPGKPGDEEDDDEH